ncbi:hypothetical protein, partial [Bacillus toyonensis]|uniref:hypothetical protein n=1 Tax=Bacillus toyonensis TaxID=155322 RepID=UPI002E1BD0E5|nr:hypothetical protein [Bacillus toyonensis]
LSFILTDPCPCQCESGLQKSSDYLIELFDETLNVRKRNLKIKMDKIEVITKEVPTLKVS